MTDSQKIDLILSGMQVMQGEINSLNTKFEGIQGEINSLNTKFEGMQGDINALRNGQTEIRKDIKKLTQKVEDTYQIALEAWGLSTENRVLLTT